MYVFQVSAQGPHLGEGLAAQAALIGPLAGVGSQVQLQVLAPFAGLAADGAGEAALEGVRVGPHLPTRCYELGEGMSDIGQGGGGLRVDLKQGQHPVLKPN